MTKPAPRSRTAWPQPATSDYATLFRQKRRVHLLLGIAVLVLALAVGTLTFFVYQQQLYIEGRGEYRDAESARVEEQSRERIRRAMCDLLGLLPRLRAVPLPDLPEWLWAEARVLSLVQQPHRDQLAEARAVIHAVEIGRPALWVVLELVVVPLLAVCLLSAGCEWAGGLLLGAAVSLALSRYGPSWWPGRR